MVPIRQFMMWSVLLIALVAVGGSVASAKLSVTVEDLNTTIMPMESATYRVTVTTDTPNEIINIQADATDWIISPQSFAVLSAEPETFELIITPKSGVGISNYRIPLVFEGFRSGDSVETNVFLSISLDLFSKGYPPNVDLTVRTDKNVDPREPFEVTVTAKNNNLRDYDKLTLSVEGTGFSDQDTIKLAPLTTVSRTFEFELDDQAQPGKRELHITATLPDGKVIAEEITSLEVSSYATFSTERIETEHHLFRSVETITITNQGNKFQTKPIAYDVSAWEDLFLKAEPQGLVTRQDGRRTLAWDVSLNPDESFEIVILRNYWSLVLIILTLIAGTVAYFLLRNPLVMLKEAQELPIDPDGTNELKIRVFVKNRSRRHIQSIKILDRIPHIAEIVPAASLGTLQPTKITKSDKRGTIVRWELDHLEPFEERIVSYKIKSKLRIIGLLSLPAAHAKFDAGSGKERVAGSGRTMVVARRK